MKEEGELTFGEKRVGVTFNPSSNGIVVDYIKSEAAKLIDWFEAMLDEKSSEEQIRLIRLAQTNIETGCMFAVKSVFK